MLRRRTRRNGTHEVKIVRCPFCDKSISRDRSPAHHIRAEHDWDDVLEEGSR